MRRLMVFLAFALVTQAAEAITDETLRLKVLSAIFPDVEIEQVERRIDSTIFLDLRPRLTFPDALALSPAYRVPGAPVDDREQCAARNELKRSISNEREVRFRLFPWPGAARGELLVILQYRFVDVQPSAACPSLAGLFRVSPSAQGWKIVDRFLLDSNRHHHVEGVRFLSLTGEPAEELVLESDSGDGARFQSDLHVLMLEHGRFQELLNVPSRFHANGEGDYWIQTLDPARTREKSGEEFCFDKSVWAAAHRRFAAPQVTHPCYPRGAGVGSSGR